MMSIINLTVLFLSNSMLDKNDQAALLTVNVNKFTD